MTRMRTTPARNRELHQPDCRAHYDELRLWQRLREDERPPHRAERPPEPRTTDVWITLPTD